MTTTVLTWGLLLLCLPSGSPAPICRPPTWEYSAFQTTALYNRDQDEAYIVYSNYTQHVDYTTQQLATVTYASRQPEATTSLTWLITDYAQKTQWTIDLFKTTCKETDVSGSMPPRCFPDDTEDLGYVSVGAGVKAHHLKLKLHANTTREVLLDPTLGLPFSYTDNVYDEPMYGVISTEVFNATSTIADRSIFTPPPYCH